MSFEEARVICVVYFSVIVPAIVYFKNRSRLPKWVLPTYVISFLACALGWELWFTYGWVDGVAVDLRRSESLNNWLPRDINWLMNSLGDAGAVLLGGFWIMWRVNNRDYRVFSSWNWSAFGILMVWCISQNILVECSFITISSPKVNLFLGRLSPLWDLTSIQSYLNLIIEHLCFNPSFLGCYCRP